MGGFQQFLQLIRDGEPVVPGVANRPIRTLDENVRYLWDLLQAANVGSTVFARQETVETSVLVGQPVYYNSTNQRWEKGLAAAETDLDTGALIPAPSSHIWGVVYTKTNATLADILLFGVVNDFSLANALPAGEAIAAGQYYLSGTTSGFLTKQRPPVTVPVLKTDGLGKVFVNPQWEALGSHIHFRFELQPLPAGDHTPPTVGTRHTITNADDSVEGWLPADHAVFEGNAPAGAVFGYNIDANAALRNAWPPLPAHNAYLEIDRGVDAAQGFHGVPLGATGLCVIDRNGIWWMSDCYGDVPWPTGLDTSASDSISLSETPECPRNMQMRLVLWFARMTFATDSTVVTSLVTDDSRLEILCETDPTSLGRTGPLLLRLNLQLTSGTDNAEGYLAFKTFNPETGQFNRGLVAEGLYAGSSGVTLTSSEQTTRQVGGDDVTVHHGLIGVSVSNSIGRDIQPSLTRLLGVSEEYYQNVMYLEFPEGEQSSIRTIFHVPQSLDLTSPKAKLRLRIIGRAAGTLPNLTVTARRLSTPSALLTPVALALSDSAVSMTTTATLANPNEYVDAESALLNVAPGEDYLFEITRAASDGFSAALGLLRHSLLLVPGS